MAINYESPGAVSNISEEYGRLQQNNLRAEFSLKQEEAKAAASARAQANANQVSEMNSRVNMAEESNRVHVAGQSAQMQASMNERMGMQESSQNFQREQRQQDFSYADSIRLQNLQQGKAYIASEVDNGNISQEEANTMLTQLDGRVGALQFAQTQTQQRHQQQQDNLRAQQAAQEATIFNRNAAFHARSLPERTSELLDPTIEAEVRSRLDPNGEANEDDAAFNRRVAQEVRKAGGATRVFESAPGHFHPLESVQSRQQQGETGAPRPMTEAQVATLHTRTLHDVNNDPDWIGKPQSQRETEAARRVALARQAASGSGQQLLPPRPLPTDDNTPLHELPADQREIMLGFNSDHAVLLGPNSRLSADEKTEAGKDIRRGVALFRAFGQAGSMPQQEQREFLAIVRRLDQLTGRSHNPGHPTGRPAAATPPGSARPGAAVFPDTDPPGVSVSDLTR